jgi:hypothetical protein
MRGDSGQRVASSAAAHNLYSGTARSYPPAVSLSPPTPEELSPPAPGKPSPPAPSPGARERGISYGGGEIGAIERSSDEWVMTRRRGGRSWAGLRADKAPLG